MSKIGKRKSKPLGPVGVTMPVVIKRERGLQKAVTMSPAEALIAEAEKQPEPVSAMAQGCREGFRRKTLIISEAHIETLKRAAHWDRVTQADILDEALAEHFKGRKYKPIPSK